MFHYSKDLAKYTFQHDNEFKMHGFCDRNSRLIHIISNISDATITISVKIILYKNLQKSKLSLNIRVSRLTDPSVACLSELFKSESLRSCHADFSTQTQFSLFKIAYMATIHATNIRVMDVISAVEHFKITYLA